MRSQQRSVLVHACAPDYAPLIARQALRDVGWAEGTLSAARADSLERQGSHVVTAAAPGHACLQRRVSKESPWRISFADTCTRACVGVGVCTSVLSSVNMCEQAYACIRGIVCGEYMGMVCVCVYDMVLVCVCVPACVHMCKYTRLSSGGKCWGWEA